MLAAVTKVRAPDSGLELDLWNRVFSRLEVSLLRLEELACFLFDRRLSNAELGEVPRVVARLAGSLVSHGFSSVADQTIQIGELLVEPDAGPANAVLLATKIERARVRLAERAEWVHVSSKSGDSVSMDGQSGAPFDEVAWALAEQGMKLAEGTSSASASVVVAGELAGEDVRRLCEVALQTNPMRPLVVVVDGDRPAQRIAALATATTILNYEPGSGSDVLIEVQRCLQLRSVAPIVSVYGDGAGWLSAQLQDRGVASSQSETLTQLLQTTRLSAAEGGLEQGQQTTVPDHTIVLTPLPAEARWQGSHHERFSILRIIRTDPALRHAKVVVIDERADQARRREAFRKGADCYFGTDVDIDELAIRIKADATRQRQGHGLRPAPDCSLYPWSDAAQLVDVYRDQAVRKGSPLGVAVLHTASPRSRTPIFDGQVAQEFRTGTVVSRHNESALVIAVPGLGRKGLVDRVRLLLENLDMSDEGLSAVCFQLPPDATDLEDVLSKATSYRSPTEPLNRQPLNKQPSDSQAVSSVVAFAHVGGLPQRDDVLVVDQEVAVASVLVSALERRGLQVARHDDGLRALAYLHKLGPTSLPRVLLVDLNLRDIQGLQFLRLLSESGLLQHMQVIVLAANHDEALLRKAFALGADDFVPKPLSAPLLVRRVQNALGTS